MREPGSSNRPDDCQAYFKPPLQLARTFYPESGTHTRHPAARSPGARCSSSMGRRKKIRSGGVRPRAHPLPPGFQEAALGDKHPVIVMRTSSCIRRAPRPDRTPPAATGALADSPLASATLLPCHLRSASICRLCVLLRGCLQLVSVLRLLLRVGWLAWRSLLRRRHRPTTWSCSAEVCSLSRNALGSLSVQQSRSWLRMGLCCSSAG